MLWYEPITNSVAAGFITRRTAASQSLGEAIVFGEGAELVPGVVDGVDAALVGPRQVAGKLQIIGWGSAKTRSTLAASMRPEDL